MIPAIENLPQIRLGFYPTPLAEMVQLSAALGGPRIFIKREDLSGLALGGNKFLKLEFMVAEASVSCRNTNPIVHHMHSCAYTLAADQSNGFDDSSSMVIE